MKGIVVLPAAEADIVEIWRYTIDRWGLDQAVRYDVTIQEKIEGLATGRTTSRPADDVRPGLRRAQAGRHVVFYRETEEAVTVVRVLHERMDVGRV